MNLKQISIERQSIHMAEQPDACPPYLGLVGGGGGAGGGGGEGAQEHWRGNR